MNPKDFSAMLRNIVSGCIVSDSAAVAKSEQAKPLPALLTSILFILPVAEDGGLEILKVFCPAIVAFFNKVVTWMSIKIMVSPKPSMFKPCSTS